MQIVRRARDDIIKIWGSGRANHSKIYRLTTYFVSAEVENGVLLCHTLTGELVFLTLEENQNLSLLPCDYAPWMDSLIQKHYLVPLETEDQNTVDTLRSLLTAASFFKGINYYCVLPTTCCNASCFYCFENGIKQETMSMETADQLARFIAANKGKSSVRIHWFGGEPTLGIKQIDRICQHLRDQEVDFYSTMTSNGYLLGDDLSGRAVQDWHLKGIQITLDGTEKVYNETKAYKKATDNPYQRVLHNIGCLLAEKVQVRIRLNLGMHNIDDLNLLVDELSERFPDKSRLMVYSHLLFVDCGFSPGYFNSEDRALLDPERKRLDDKIARYSFYSLPPKLPSLKEKRCKADDDSSLIVFPSGRFGKCDLFSESHFVGDVVNGLTNLEEIQRHKERAIYQECTGCPLYPGCVKLKICRNRGCSATKVAEQKESTISSMKFIYEEYLRNDKNKISPATDYQKGENHEGI